MVTATNRHVRMHDYVCELTHIATFNGCTQPYSLSFVCVENCFLLKVYYMAYIVVLNGIQSRVLPMQEKLSARVRSPCVFTHSHPLCFTSCHIAAPRTAGSERSVVSRGLKCEVSTMCNVWFTLVILVLKKGLCFDDGGLRLVVTLESCSSYLRFYRLCGWQPVHLQVSR